jgi:hypothetical protein
MSRLSLSGLADLYPERQQGQPARDYRMQPQPGGRPLSVGGYDLVSPDMRDTAAQDAAIAEQARRADAQQKELDRLSWWERFKNIGARLGAGMNPDAQVSPAEMPLPDPQAEAARIMEEQRKEQVRKSSPYYQQALIELQAEDRLKRLDAQYQREADERLKGVGLPRIGLRPGQQPPTMGQAMAEEIAQRTREDRARESGYQYETGALAEDPFGRTQMRSGTPGESPQYPLLRDIGMGLRNAGGALGSVALRMFGSDDLANQAQAYIEGQRMRQEQERTGDRFPSMTRAAAGATESAATLLGASAVGGMPAVIATYGAEAFDQGLYDAKQAGLVGNDQLRYAAGEAAIASLVSPIMDRLGMSGVEKAAMAQRVANRTMRNAFGNLAKTEAGEFGQELLELSLSSALQAETGVDPQALELSTFMPRVADTALTTMLTVGAVESPNIAAAVDRFIREPSRKNYAGLPEEIRAPLGDTVKSSADRQRLAEQLIANQTPPQTEPLETARNRSKPEEALQPGVTSPPGPSAGSPQLPMGTPGVQPEDQGVPSQVPVLSPGEEVIVDEERMQRGPEGRQREVVAPPVPDPTEQAGGIPVAAEPAAAPAETAPAQWMLTPEDTAIAERAIRDVIRAGKPRIQDADVDDLTGKVLDVVATQFSPERGNLRNYARKLAKNARTTFMRERQRGPEQMPEGVTDSGAVDPAIEAQINERARAEGIDINVPEVPDVPQVGNAPPQPDPGQAATDMPKIRANNVWVGQSGPVRINSTKGGLVTFKPVGAAGEPQTLPENEFRQQYTPRGATQPPAQPVEPVTTERPLYDRAVDFAVGKGVVSTGMLQREFGLGYTGAAQLIDQMTDSGVIAPSTGAQERKVLLTSAPQAVAPPAQPSVPPTEQPQQAGLQTPSPQPVDTIAGRMDLTEFETKGYAPEQVTRQDWINLQRAERRRLGQPEESGTQYAPFADYEEFHRDAVRQAVARGDEVDPQVLADYPDLAPASSAVEPEKTIGQQAEPESQPTPAISFEQFADAMERSERGAKRDGSLVSFGDLRRETGLSKPDFDATVLRFKAEGKLNLHTDDFPGNRTAEERERFIPTKTERGDTYFLGASISETARDELARQPAATPQATPEATPAPPAESPQKPVKPRTPGKPLNRTQKDAALRHHFTPGKIVPSYSGQDRVIAFNPGGPESTWSVDVQAVDESGTPIEGEVVRRHGTEPDAKTLLKAYDDLVASQQATARPTEPEAKPARKRKESPEREPYRRTTDASPEGRALLRSQTEAYRDRITELEPRLKDARKRLANTRSNAHKKRGEIQTEINEIENEIGRWRRMEQKAADEYRRAAIEDAMEDPKSDLHRQAGLRELAMLDFREAERRGADAREKRDRGSYDAAMKQMSSLEDRIRAMDHDLEAGFSQIAIERHGDALTPNEIASVASLSKYDFNVDSRGTPESVIDSRAEEQIAGRKNNVSLADISGLPEDDRQRLEKQIEDDLRKKEWHETVTRVRNEASEIARTAREESQKRKAKEAQEAAEEKRKSDIAEAKEKYAQRKSSSTELRYWKQLKERASKIKTQKDVSGKYGDDAVKGDAVGETWLIYAAGKGDYVLIHRPSGIGVTHATNPSNAKQLILMLEDAGIDMSKYETADSIPADVAKLAGQIVRAWDNEDFQQITDDGKRGDILSRVQKPDVGVKFDIEVDAADVESAKKIGSKSAEQRLREFVREVPEFGYNPVFTVDDNKRLVFKDGFKFALNPELFGIDADILEPGFRVAVNLEDIGIARPTAAEVVKDVLSREFKVTKSGPSVFAVKPLDKPDGPAVVVRQGSGEEWIAGTGSDAPHYARVEQLLKGIPWRESEQVAKNDKAADADAQESLPPVVAAPYKDDFARILPVLDRQVRAEISPNKQKTIAISHMDGEPPAIQRAIAERLQQIAPDAVRSAIAQPKSVPIGMMAHFRAVTTELDSERPGGSSAVGMPAKSSKPVPAVPRDMPLLLPPAGDTGKPVAIRTIMNALEQAVSLLGNEVPIRVGKMSQRTALGIFKVHDEVARIREANDLETAAHEMGHAIDKLINGWPKGGPWKTPRVQKLVQDELTAIGRSLYVDTAPTGGYKREGWAEFARLWLTDPESAAKFAPHTSEWYRDTFEKAYPKAAAALREVQGMITKWREQGAKARQSTAIIDTGSVPQRVERIKKWAKHAVSMEAHIEMLEPLWGLAREAEKRTGRELAATDDPYAIADALRMVHHARVETWVRHGMTDLAGMPTGVKPLSDVGKLIPEQERNDFVLYLWARRALALILDPRGPRNPGMSLNEAEYLIAELDNPRFREAAQIVYDWNDGVLDYAASASPVFADVVQRIRARDPGAYIPLARYFRELDEIYSRSGGGNDMMGTLMGKLRGSGREIKDPIPQMIANATKMAHAAHDRMILDAIQKLSANVQGLGKYIEKVPRDKVPAAAVSVEELLRTLEKKLSEQEIDMTLTRYDEPVEKEDLQDLIGETVTFFTTAINPSGPYPIMPMYDATTKKIEWFYLNGNLYHALGAIEMAGLPMIGGFNLLAPLAALNRLRKAGTVGLRAAFQLFTNPTRDLQTLLQNTQSRATLPKVAWEYARQTLGAAWNLLPGTQPTSAMQFWRNAGGHVAQMLGEDTARTRELGSEVFGKKFSRRLLPSNWWSNVKDAYDIYKDIVQIPEATARATEVQLLMDEMGIKPGDRITLEQSLRLLTAGKKVTVDFSAAGEFARVWNQLAPFYNVAIQGPRSMVRAAQKNPFVFTVRLAQVAALSALLWWRNKDEEWYRKLNTRLKTMYWSFRYGDQVILLPKAFENGVGVAGFVESMLDQQYGQNPEAVTEWFHQFMETATPNYIPGVADEVLAQAMNEDLFWKTPIESPELQRMPRHERFNEYTSGVAKWLGKTMKWSPARIDHALRGIAGPMAGDVTRTLDEIVGVSTKRTREWEPADLPVIGKAFQRGGIHGTRTANIDRLYERRAEMNLRSNSKENPETPQQRQQRLMLNDAAEAVSDIYQARRQMEKTEDRGKATDEADRIATDALKRLESGTLPPERIAILVENAISEGKSEKAQQESREALLILKQSGLSAREITQAYTKKKRADKERVLPSNLNRLRLRLSRTKAEE